MYSEANSHSYVGFSFHCPKLSCLRDESALLLLCFVHMHVRTCSVIPSCSLKELVKEMVAEDIKLFKVNPTA